MITKENLKFCFESLNKEEVNTALNSDNDFLLFWLHTFNAGSYATLEAKEYSEEAEQEANDNGQLFIDKDQFLQLYEESEANNEFIQEHI